ncbi:hypothetical protein HMPREF0381_2661 [Lachnoanaerobaculum saburreum DSM 3986]|uniref:Uncharacterized protein n=1 Tax=Lachnoanaerobaculum saburreum DSM 3986 TaxID=887325 RepID=E6LRS6_9FIRM|nr:hypothetical protein HMPREF0381_2661 [Lachnoanaerobaculum saburreum DSM 3986]
MDILGLYHLWLITFKIIFKKLLTEYEIKYILHSPLLRRTNF